MRELLTSLEGLRNRLAECAVDPRMKPFHSELRRYIADCFKMEKALKEQL